MKKVINKDLTRSDEIINQVKKIIEEAREEALIAMNQSQEQQYELIKKINKRIEEINNEIQRLKEEYKVLVPAASEDNTEIVELMHQVNALTKILEEVKAEVLTAESKSKNQQQELTKQFNENAVATNMEIQELQKKYVELVENQSIANTEQALCVQKLSAQFNAYQATTDDLMQHLSEAWAQAKCEADAEKAISSQQLNAYKATTDNVMQNLNEALAESSNQAYAQQTILFQQLNEYKETTYNVIQKFYDALAKAANQADAQQTILSQQLNVYKATTDNVMQYLNGALAEAVNQSYAQQTILSQQLNAYKATTDNAIQSLNEALAEAANQAYAQQTILSQQLNAYKETTDNVMQNLNEALAESANQAYAQQTIWQPEADLVDPMLNFNLNANQTQTHTPQFDVAREREIEAAVLENVLQTAPVGVSMHVQSGCLPLTTYLHNKFQQTVYEYARARHLADC